MKRLSRPARSTAEIALALIGMPLITRLVQAAQNANCNDLAALNSAIELERAGSEAYLNAAATGLLTPAMQLVAANIAADHLAHGDALIAAVIAGGGVPTTQTLRYVCPTLRNQTDVLEYALDVEQIAATTYLALICDLNNRGLAHVAASILAIDMTHVRTLTHALRTPSHGLQAS